MDSSALVKRYVREVGSEEVGTVIASAAAVGTAVLTRAEVGAAFAKAVRLGLLAEQDGRLALGALNNDWAHLVRVPVSEEVVSRAVEIAWEHALRGYDAVQLAAALHWRGALDRPIRFVTFDRALWIAAERNGLEPTPAAIP